jgi:DnaK suppressor protein
MLKSHDKIYKLLEKRFVEITSKLKGEFGSLPDCQGGGDVIDAAFNAINGNASSSLLQIGSEELKQIRRAMDLIKAGQYGICESCDSKISTQRLSALPYITLCIGCQRKKETNPDNDDDESNWDKNKSQDDSDDLPSIQIVKS